MDLEALVVSSAIALWFAHGWYLNTRLERVHAKLDALKEEFGGLRTYLYEIDPQFDDERELEEELNRELGNATGSFAGAELSQLVHRKRESGKRTLSSPFSG